MRTGGKGRKETGGKEMGFGRKEKKEGIREEQKKKKKKVEVINSLAKSKNNESGI